jgi:hypothetical protein
MQTTMRTKASARVRASWVPSANLPAGRQGGFAFGEDILKRLLGHLFL